MRARSTRFEEGLEACEDCTSCNIGGTVSVHQEHRPSLTDSGGGEVSTKPVQGVKHLPLNAHL